MKIKTENGKEYIFDVVRKKYIQNLPEEWVRQNMIHYLNKEKGYPISLMSIESSNKLHEINHRCDIICNDKNGNPLILVECKSQKTIINKKAFNQILNYQRKVQASHMLITNGINHFCFKTLNNKTIFLKSIPNYKELANTV